MLAGDGRAVVIVPAYRARTTLRRTLDAVLDDNRDRVAEVVVVVSGEDDGAPVEAAQRERVTVVRSPVRLSAGAARNLGRSHAGDAPWLLFVDADCAPAPGSVARLIAAAQRDGVAAVSASVSGTGAGGIGWLRHVLEFKDSAAGTRSRHAGRQAPSATLLCRARAFDAVGGFPDMWPGEDLVLCERFRREGLAVLRLDDAVTTHLHPGGWRPFLAHQYRLGRTSALARALTRMDGAGFVRSRWLVALLPVGRGARALMWLLAHQPRRIPLFILVSPLYVAGLMSWTIGFARASRQCAA